MPKVRKAGPPTMLKKGNLSENSSSMTLVSKDDTSFVISETFNSECADGILLLFGEGQTLEY